MTGRGCWIVALAALLALSAPIPRASAVENVTPAARGLADSRLYVDPAVAGTVDAATRSRLRTLLRPRREPILVALVAFAPGDTFDGDGPRFLTALAGRVQRPGVYVTYDARGILWTRGYRMAHAVAVRAGQAARITNLESGYDGPPGPRLESFLGVLDDPDLAAREVAASEAFNKRVGRDRRPAADADDDGGSGARLAGVVALGVLLVVAAALLARRRRRARHVDDRPLLPGRIFELAREASRDDLAERARAALIELSGLIDAASASAAGTQRALDAYEAAERALRADEPDVPDLVGALVCIDLGREALRDAGPAQAPPCTYDPRHGPARGGPVRVEGSELRLCRACRSDVRGGRPADVLRDGDGQPYLDGDGPWAASGYGAWSDPIRAVLDPR